MITFIIIFGVSLIAILAFIYVRVHEIRAGKTPAPTYSDVDSRRVYTKVVQTKEKTTWYGKNIFKLSILLFLKFFVFMGFVLKQIAEEIKEFIKQKTTPKKPSSGKTPSAFIGTIREYKKELSRFNKKLEGKK